MRHLRHGDDPRESRATAATPQDPRAGRFDPPLATSIGEFLRPTIWIYDGLERAVPTAARLPFVPPNDPDVAKRWAEARSTLEERAAGKYPKAIAFFTLAILLLIAAVVVFAVNSNGAGAVAMVAAVYLIGRGAMFLSAGRISSDRIREELLERKLCPCCVSDLGVAGQFVTSRHEATRCVTCGCLWYPLHGKLRYFATRITACRWCGYGIHGLVPDQQGLICCPECGKRGVGPLHVVCGKCAALVPMTLEESTKGWMTCANCSALNMVARPDGVPPSGLEGQWTDDASADSVTIAQDEPA